MFSDPDSDNKNLKSLELFISHISDINKASLHTKFHAYTPVPSVLKIHTIKNVSVGPKSFQGFQENGPLAKYDWNKHIIYLQTTHCLLRSSHKVVCNTVGNIVSVDLLKFSSLKKQS